MKVAVVGAGIAGLTASGATTSRTVREASSNA